MRLYLILSLSFLTSCSLIHGKPDVDYDKSLSKAMNVAQLGEITNSKRGPIIDTRYQEVEKALLKNTAKSDAINAAPLALSAAKLSGSMMATPGISNSLGGGLMLLRALTTSDRVPVLTSGVLAWMPASFATDKKDAVKKIKELLRVAYLKALPSNVTSKAVIYTRKSTFGISSNHPRDILEGGACQFSEHECQLVTYARKPYETTNVPAWLGYDKAYFWTFSKDPAYAWAKIIKNTLKGIGSGKKSFTAIQNRDYLQKVSNFLPKWIYLYEPPNKDKSQNENYPVIFNRGEALYFIEPKPETNQALNN